MERGDIFVMRSVFTDKCPVEIVTVVFINTDCSASVLQEKERCGQGTSVRSRWKVLVTQFSIDAIAVFIFTIHFVTGIFLTREGNPLILGRQFPLSN